MPPEKRKCEQLPSLYLALYPVDERQHLTIFCVQLTRARMSTHAVQGECPRQQVRQGSLGVGLGFGSLSGPLRHHSPSEDGAQVGRGGAGCVLGGASPGVVGKLSHAKGAGGKLTRCVTPSNCAACCLVALSRCWQHFGLHTFWVVNS